MPSTRPWISKFLQAGIDGRLHLDATQHHVATVMYSMRNDATGQCSPSIGLLARITRRSEHTVQRAVRALKGSIIIGAHQMSQYEWQYDLIDPDIIGRSGVATVATPERSRGSQIEDPGVAISRSRGSHRGYPNVNERHQQTSPPPRRRRETENREAAPPSIEEAAPPSNDREARPPRREYRPRQPKRDHQTPSPRERGIVNALRAAGMAAAATFVRRNGHAAAEAATRYLLAERDRLEAEGTRDVARALSGAAGALYNDPDLLSHQAPVTRTSRALQERQRIQQEIEE